MGSLPFGQLRNKPNKAWLKPCRSIPLRGLPSSEKTTYPVAFALIPNLGNHLNLYASAQRNLRHAKGAAGVGAAFAKDLA